jgi:hypothetical protein
MRPFAERFGYRAARATFQIETMDNALRTALWNALVTTMFDAPDSYAFQAKAAHDPTVVMARMIYDEMLKRRVDSIPLNHTAI